ncbi:MAG: YIP1 family protein [Maribacter sp.]|nr:YIP1 family protein [Maribacter sp.]
MSNFSQFWVQLLMNPKKFFAKNLQEDKINYLNFATIVFCLGYGIDRLEKQLVKFELRGTLDTYEFINTWLGFWLIALVGGAIGGYILYLIGGWFYNLRVKWSLGEGNLKKSRILYLYSNFYISAVIILITLLETVINPIPYDPYAEMHIIEIISIPIILFFLFHSIYISYSGLSVTTEVNKGRAIVWFIVLPILFYTVAYSTLFYILINYI